MDPKTSKIFNFLHASIKSSHGPKPTNPPNYGRVIQGICRNNIRPFFPQYLSKSSPSASNPILPFKSQQPADPGRLALKEPVPIPSQKGFKFPLIHFKRVFGGDSLSFCVISSLRSLSRESSIPYTSLVPSATMISAVKQPQSSAFAGIDVLRSTSPSHRRRIACPPLSVSLVPSSLCSASRLSLKPLCVSSQLKSLGLGSGSQDERLELRCEAYEAERSDDVAVPAEEPRSAAAQKVKIGIYFASWWALNVVFNIYNKKVLNAFPYPWLTSTLSLACGSLMMLISWATRIAEAPKTDFEFWKALFPVALAHTIGHVAATVSMSKVAVSFTHIIKSGEPAFSVLVSRFLLGETFPVPVYLSLLPIIGGCALAAVTELNFNMTGFMGAMISNIAFVFRNIFSKKGMKGRSVSGMNYYACLSMMSLLILTPFAIAVEGPQMWAAGWQTAISQIGPQFIWWVAAQSVFYHMYNQVSYMSLDEISPLTFSIGNTMKRISVIVSSIIIFHTPVLPVNALGAAIAILGTFLYSQAKQ